METVWNLLGFLGLFFLELCNGLPINLENSGPDSHTQFLTGLVAVLLTVCSVVLLAGCLCCQRRNGFKEFRDSPVAASVANSLDHGHVNPIANSEFTIFTPISPPHLNNNVFVANQRIVNRTQEDYKYGDIDVTYWFDGSEEDFPRTKLKYIRELGKGWFGRVVEGTAQGLSENPEEWSSVVVRILEASATTRERVLFLYDATIYRCGSHPNILQVLGRSLDTIPLLLLQEYCIEGDLKRYLRNNKSMYQRFLSSDLPLLWCYQLTSAVKFLHSHKITHPDLAARNCQLSKDLQLKLGDYGLSATLYPEDYYEGVPGIPLRWCAPETISYTSTTIQSKQITYEGNIWSLGIVLWEICECGDQPYSWLTDDEVVAQVIETPKVRLPRPSYSTIYSDYLYRLMQSCWSTSESRPSICQIDLMLADLMQVYEHTKTIGHNKSSASLQDFDKRWETLKPNALVKSDDEETVDTEGYESDLRSLNALNLHVSNADEFLNNKKLSASLNNLHGSLDNLLEFKNNFDPMESWLENIASDTGDLSYVKGVSDAIKDLDNAIALENVSSDSSHQQSPIPDVIPRQFQLGQIFKPKLSSTSSGSETEDETWKRRIERGVYSEKVRQKSRSVADLMILTHIDCSESDSETTLPSIDYKVNYKNVRYIKNIDNASLKFGSEGNLLSVQDTFQDELRKLQEERRDSLLFVPDIVSQNSSSLSNISKVNCDLPNSSSTSDGNSPVKKLIEELQSPAEIMPPKQVYNVFNVSIEQNYSPLCLVTNINDAEIKTSNKCNQNKIKNNFSDTSSNKSDLSPSYETDKTSEGVGNKNDVNEILDTNNAYTTETNKNCLDVQEMCNLSDYFWVTNNKNNFSITSEVENFKKKLEEMNAEEILMYNANNKNLEISKTNGDKIDTSLNPHDILKPYLSNGTLLNKENAEILNDDQHQSENKQMDFLQNEESEKQLINKENNNNRQKDHKNFTSHKHIVNSDYKIENQVPRLVNIIQNNIELSDYIVLNGSSKSDNTSMESLNDNVLKDRLTDDEKLLQNVKHFYDSQAININNRISIEDNEDIPSELPRADLDSNKDIISLNGEVLIERKISNDEGNSGRNLNLLLKVEEENDCVNLENSYLNRNSTKLSAEEIPSNNDLNSKVGNLIESYEHFNIGNDDCELNETRSKLASPKMQTEKSLALMQNEETSVDWTSEPEELNDCNKEETIDQNQICNDPSQDIRLTSTQENEEMDESHSPNADVKQNCIQVKQSTIDFLRNEQIGDKLSQSLFKSIDGPKDFIDLSEQQEEEKDNKNADISNIIELKSLCHEEMKPNNPNAEVDQKPFICSGTREEIEIEENLQTSVEFNLGVEKLNHDHVEVIQETEKVDSNLSDGEILKCSNEETKLITALKEIEEGRASVYLDVTVEGNSVLLKNDGEMATSKLDFDAAVSNYLCKPSVEEGLFNLETSTDKSLLEIGKVPSSVLTKNYVTVGNDVQDEEEQLKTNEQVAKQEILKSVNSDGEGNIPKLHLNNNGACHVEVEVNVNNENSKVNNTKPDEEIDSARLSHPLDATDKKEILLPETDFTNEDVTKDEKEMEKVIPSSPLKKTFTTVGNVVQNEEAQIRVNEEIELIILMEESTSMLKAPQLDEERGIPKLLLNDNSSCHVKEEAKVNLNNDNSKLSHQDEETKLITLMEELDVGRSSLHLNVMEEKQLLLPETDFTNKDATKKEEGEEKEMEKVILTIGNNVQDEEVQAKMNKETELIILMEEMDPNKLLVNLNVEEGRNLVLPKISFTNEKVTKHEILKSLQLDEERGTPKLPLHDNSFQVKGEGDVNVNSESSKLNNAKQDEGTKLITPTEEISLHFDVKEERNLLVPKTENVAKEEKETDTAKLYLDTFYNSADIHRVENELLSLEQISSSDQQIYDPLKNVNEEKSAVLESEANENAEYSNADDAKIIILEENVIKPSPLHLNVKEERNLVLEDVNKEEQLKIDFVGKTPKIHLSENVFCHVKENDENSKLQEEIKTFITMEKIHSNESLLVKEERNLLLPKTDFVKEDVTKEETETDKNSIKNTEMMPSFEKNVYEATGLENSHLVKEETDVNVNKENCKLDYIKIERREGTKLIVPVEEIDSNSLPLHLDQEELLVQLETSEDAEENMLKETSDVISNTSDKCRIETVEICKIEDTAGKELIVLENPCLNERGSCYVNEEAEPNEARLLNEEQAYDEIRKYKDKIDTLMFLDTERTKYEETNELNVNNKNAKENINKEVELERLNTEINLNKMKGLNTTSEEIIDKLTEIIKAEKLNQVKKDDMEINSVQSPSPVRKKMETRFELSGSNKIILKPIDEKRNQLLTRDFLINEVQKYGDAKRQVNFDLSENQEEIAPNSLTHFSVYTSTPCMKRSLEPTVILGASDDYSIDFYSGLKTSTNEADDLQFSSNFTHDNEKPQKLFAFKSPDAANNSNLKYSLETWDSFLGKAFDDQENSRSVDFSNFSSEEPQSLLFLDGNKCDGKDKIVAKDFDGNVTKVLNENYVPNKEQCEDDVMEKDGSDLVEQNLTYDINDVLLTEDKQTQKDCGNGGNWESGGGWFLHPQSHSGDLTGQIVPSQVTGSDSYVGFSMDDEIMAAIRNELLSKLPHAQRVSSEQLEDDDEIDPSEKNEVFVRYNVYSTPLSPIPEETCVDSDTSGRVTPLRCDNSDDDSSGSDWSVQDNSTNGGTETQSPRLIESPIKGPLHQHTSSQDSCCSNDTLFNLEELNTHDHDKLIDVYDIENKQNEKICEHLQSFQKQEENLDVSSVSKDVPTVSYGKVLDQTVKEDEINACRVVFDGNGANTKESGVNVPKISVHSYIDEFLTNERYSFDSLDDTIENEEASSNTDAYLTVSDNNTISFGHNIAPLNSPEDKPWKELQASFRRCEEEMIEDNDILEALNETYLSCEDTLENEGETINIEPETNDCEKIKDSVDLSKEKQECLESSDNTEHVSLEDFKNKTNLSLLQRENHLICDGILDTSSNLTEEMEDKRTTYEDMYGPLADIRFSGPANTQLMTTSFSESADLMDEQDWDSGSDTRSSSSGEFIWREGEHEASVKALHAAPQPETSYEMVPMDYIQEESESSCSSGSEGEDECPEFVPSAWDKFATPSKSALRSPEKSLERADKKSKAVWFKKQKYHCVYEYPREPDSPLLQSYDLWKPTPDYKTLTDWDLDGDPYLPTTLDEPDFGQEYQLKNDKVPRNLYHLTPFPDLTMGSTMLDEDFFISSSSRPFDMLGGLTSQFFPGKQFLDNWNENPTPDSGVEDITPGSQSDNIEFSKQTQSPLQVQTLKSLASAAAKRIANNSRNIELGGLRHTRDKLKLDLPPSPTAFTSSRSFTVEPAEEIVNRQVPAFTTFGKSRFLVQHVDTPPDDKSDKNVSFEALPYKPAKQYYKSDLDKEKHKVEIVRGEASLLDSADEDSGIESCTLERRKGVNV